METEIKVRWIVFENGEKIGEGTTVASPTILNKMTKSFTNNLQFFWERIK